MFFMDVNVTLDMEVTTAPREYVKVELTPAGSAKLIPLTRVQLSYVLAQVMDVQVSSNCHLWVRIPGNG